MEPIFLNEPRLGAAYRASWAFPLRGNIVASGNSPEREDPESSTPQEGSRKSSSGASSEIPLKLFQNQPILLSGKDDGTYEKHGVSFFFGEDDKYYYGLTAQHVLGGKFKKGSEFGVLIGKKACFAECVATENNTGFLTISASSFFGKPPTHPRDFALFRVSKDGLAGEGIIPTLLPFVKLPESIADPIPVCGFGIRQNDVVYGKGAVKRWKFPGVLEIADTDFEEGSSGSSVIDVRTG